ncbi:MAG: FdtA/QdtA family cupin domain-containing protein, partial [Bacteroidota bacterium]
LDEVKLIQLPKFNDERGNLSFIEGGKHIPFAIERLYMIYDVPGGETRGGHAYHTLDECIVALSGSFEVVLSDGNETRRFSLNRSYFGLYVPKLVWRSLENFSTNGLCLILASQPYNEADYIRDFENFKSIRSLSECAYKYML